MSSFYEMLLAHGLRPRSEPVPDGRWRRCATESHPKKKNGAYLLTTDGRVGFFQDWAVHSDPVTWRAEAGAGVPVLDYRAIRERNERADAERARAIQGARDYYEGCAALIGGHPYLEAHGLDMTGCRGLRQDARGYLIVPLSRGRELLSIQRIAPDGEKRFWPGAPTSGASYTLERAGATLTVLCEGLATGLALYAAVPLSRVVVAFNAGNLPRVAAQLPRRGMVVVAADNDHETEARIGRNPGVDAARDAAAALGCGVAIPTGVTGTDWCDFRVERIAAVGARPLYGSRLPSATNVRRCVDGEIATALLRAARFLTAAG